MPIASEVSRKPALIFRKLQYDKYLMLPFPHIKTLKKPLENEKTALSIKVSGYG